MKTTYNATCTQCYSEYKTGMTRKEASEWATSHIKIYGHHVITGEDYKADVNKPGFNPKGKPGGQG